MYSSFLKRLTPVGSSGRTLGFEVDNDSSDDVPATSMSSNQATAVESEVLALRDRLKDNLHYKKFLKMRIQIELLVDNAKISGASSYILESILNEAETLFRDIKSEQGNVMQAVCGNSLEDLSLKLLSYFNVENLKILEDISSIKDLLNRVGPHGNSVIGSSDPSNINSKLTLKPPELKLGKFEDNRKDPFSYIHFKSNFLTVMNSTGLDDASRLIYLKNCLLGKTLSYIESLSCSAENYHAAWHLLDGMFLNEGALINNLLQQIVSWPVVHNLSGVNDLINKLRSYLFELKKLNLDFLADSPGFHLLSSVVSLKLPKFYTMELCRKTGDSIVKVDALFEFQSLLDDMLKSPKTSKDAETDDGKRSVTFSKAQKYDDTSISVTTDKSVKGCKFCFSILHSSLHCRKYDSHAKRRDRAISLKLCTRCLAKNHCEESCPGKSNNLKWSCSNCTKNNHVTPLCPTLVLSLFQNSSSHNSKKN